MEPQAIATLVEMLSHRDAAVRREAVQALKVYGWSPANDEERAWQALARQDYEQVIALGTAAVKPLAILLQDSVAANRLAALEMMLSLKPRPPLQTLAPALKDPEPAVRLVGVQALAQDGGAAALELLGRVLDDPAPDVRAAALDALKRKRGPETVPLMIRALADSVPDLRWQAAEALGEAGDTSALPALTSALFDGEPTVRRVVLDALMRLVGDWDTSKHAETVLGTLETACREGAPERRLLAREILKSLGRTPRRAPGEMSNQQLAAIMALSGALQARNRDLRQGAVEALGHLRDPRAIAPLTKALQDPDEWVRRAAVYALDNLGWEPANQVTLARQSVILQRWDAALACGEAALEPLLLALDCSGSATPNAAMACLGRLGSSRAIEPLTGRLLSGPPEGRRAAAEALSALGWRPPDPSLAARQALALNNWEEAARHGAASVDLLVSFVKENPPGSDCSTAALKALANVDDPRAAGPLLACTRDSQVAATAVQALRQTLEKNAAQVEAADLAALAKLSNVYQFQYAFDARYGTTVRTAMKEVDISPVSELAQQELARRDTSARGH
jgi:HEAT repeat protein